MTKILLNLNQEKFQDKLFKLEKNEQRALLNTLEKIKKLSWEQLYCDKGLNWESITTKRFNQENVYSFRFSQKYRGTAYRNGEYLVLLNLFTNHDGAYE